MSQHRLLPIRRRTLIGGFSALLLPRVTWAQAAPADAILLRAQPGATGPTIRVQRGSEIVVRFVNALGQPAALHWHGVRLPNPMDGVPGLTQAPVAPGAAFDYRFVAPDAGTYWYHPLALPGVAPPGFCGALIVDEATPPPVDREALLLVDRIPEAADAAPRIAVRTNERVRLRLINALATMLMLRIDDHRATVMAIDGQPSEPFAARDGRLALGPGNRIDLFVDAALPPGSTSAIAAQAGRDWTLAQLAYASGPPARPLPPPEPAALPANGLPERMDLAGALRVDLPLSDAPLADAAKAPLFSVRRGRTVVLALKNATGSIQVVHPHGHSVRLLDRLDDGWKPFWLDTLTVPPNETMRIAFVADNPGQWAIDLGAIGAGATGRRWFEVT